MLHTCPGLEFPREGSFSGSGKKNPVTLVGEHVRKGGDDFYSESEFEFESVVK